MSHDDYCEGPEATKWCKGIRYEVARILRYIQDDFKLPPRNKMYLTTNQIAKLENRHFSMKNGNLDDYVQLFEPSSGK